MMQVVRNYLGFFSLVFFLLSCEKFQNKLHQQAKKPAESHGSSEPQGGEHVAASEDAAAASHHGTEGKHEAASHGGEDKKNHERVSSVCEKNSASVVIFEETTSEFFYCKDGSFKKIPVMPGMLPHHKKKRHHKSHEEVSEDHHPHEIEHKANLGEKDHHDGKKKKKVDKKFYCKKSNLADYVCKPRKSKQPKEPKEH